MNGIRIRPATNDDAAAIATLYNHYVRETTVTFEEVEVTSIEMASRLAAVAAAGLPWTVATDDLEVRGYAYASPWRPRSAYRFSVETTVYLAADAVGRGLGTRLYADLLERLEALGLHVALGGIALPNDASVALHEKCGFRKVAHLPGVGFKFDRWIDVGYWQRPLAARYHLRPAGPDDVDRLEALIDVSVRGLGPGFYTAAQIEAGLRDVFGVDTQLIADGTYFVVEHDGDLVACGGWSGRRTLFGGDRYKSGGDTCLDPATQPARIRAFFVHPVHARRGLGRRLYEACAGAARAEGFTAFELMATLPGVPLYTALGFEALDPVAVPTRDEPLPCVRMRRDI